MSEDAAAWIGREQSAQDRLAAERVEGFEALVNDRAAAPVEGEAAPPLIHWLLFQRAAPLSEAGPDGHTRRGGFLPPIEAPRRMWAGGRIDFLRPLRVGSLLERRSRITTLAEKNGRQGPLTLVTITHEINDAEGPALREEQDLVFRQAPKPGETPAAPQAAPRDCGWRRQIRPTPLMLFRYSALTMNGHRIHYDHPYATGVEGYPGLVVHGPLLATLLLSGLVAEAPARAVRRFAYRAMRPVFDTGPFEVCGTLRGDDAGADLFIRGPGEALCMQAEALFA